MTQAIALPLETSVGNLDSYIHSVNSFPLLSQEEEVELATQYRQENNLEAARRLVVSHLRVVVSIASDLRFPRFFVFQEVRFLLPVFLSAEQLSSTLFFCLLLYFQNTFFKSTGFKTGPDRLAVWKVCAYFMAWRSAMCPE